MCLRYIGGCTLCDFGVYTQGCTPKRLDLVEHRTSRQTPQPTDQLPQDVTTVKHL